MEKLGPFTPEELQLMLSGEQVPQWTREDIMNYTEPKFGYTRDTPGFQKFVNVLVSMSGDERKVRTFLLFRFISWHLLSFNSFVRLFVPCSFLLSFVRSFVRLFVYLFVRSVVRSFVSSFICSFFLSFVCSFVQLFVRSYVRLFVRSFVRLLVHLLVRSFVCSFVRSSVRPFVRSSVHPSCLPPVTQSF